VAKRCIFCGGGAPFSNEHVLPEWASELIGVGDVRVTSAKLNQRPTTWEHVGSFGVTVNRVCLKCNNGWMSCVENAAKPSLCPMILSRSVVWCGPQQQRAIARWLLTRAIVHEHPTGGHYFNADERRSLCDQGALPGQGVSIWISAYCGSEDANLKGGVVKFGALDGRKVNAYLMTMSLQRFAAQVLCLRDHVRVEPQYDFSAAERTIWPRARPIIRWRRSPALDDQLFKKWHARWGPGKRGFSPHATDR
jgi:hypothetical protein